MTGLLLALALAAAPAAADRGLEVLAPAPGGPAVLLAPRAGPHAALVIRFDVGAADDVDEDGPAPGLTHLTQIAMLRANARLDYVGLVKELFEANGAIRIETGIESCEFSLDAAAADFDRLAARLLDALLGPGVQAGAPFERARENALHDRREGRGGAFLSELAHLTVSDPAYGGPPHGDRATLERLTSGQVRAHAARWFTPAAATVAFAGAFDVQAARAVARRWRGGARRARGSPSVSTPFAVASPGARELYLLAHRAPSPPSAAAWVLAAVLEERLQERFRASGISYAQGVEVLEEPWLQGLLLVLPTAAKGPEARVAPEAERALQELREGGVSAEDVERNKGYLLGGLARMENDPVAMARELARARRGLPFGPARAAAIAAVDREAVASAAKELFAEREAIRILLTPEVDRSSPLPERVRAAPRRTP